MFHNIFSKKESQENNKKQNKTLIIVDNRERNSLVPSELIRLDNKIEFQHLEIADYLINDIAIERKTISDLKSSIINKRIFEQIHQLRQYEKSLLIIEGISNEDIYQGILHENALRGFFLSIAIENKIPFILTKDEKDTSKYISILANKKQNKEISLRLSRILQTKEEQLQFILEGFPHIGPAKAKALLSKFHSLKNIINATEEDLQEILGKRTKEFKALMN